MFLRLYFRKNKKKKKSLTLLRKVFFQRSDFQRSFDPVNLGRGVKGAENILRWKYEKDIVQKNVKIIDIAEVTYHCPAI